MLEKRPMQPLYKDLIIILLIFQIKKSPSQLQNILIEETIHGQTWFLPLFKNSSKRLNSSRNQRKILDKSKTDSGAWYKYEFKIVMYFLIVAINYFFSSLCCFLLVTFAHPIIFPSKKIYLKIDLKKINPQRSFFLSK